MVRLIGVDAGALAISPKQRRGVYYFNLNLIKALKQIDRRNKYLLFSNPTFGWNYFGLPLKLFSVKPDVFLGLNQALPFLLPCRSLVVVYDLAFEYYPDYYSDKGHRLKRITRRAVRKADKILSISETTKKDLIKTYRVPGKKITVIYGGCEPIFKPQAKKEIERVKRKYSFKNYFLYVGAFKPTKNIDNIIAGFEEFKKKTKLNYELKLVGGNENYVPRKDLPALYQGATGFVSPSFYEGFGLPLVEAMACGTPVITSNYGATKEVVGNAGYLVNPKNPQEIAVAMQQLASANSLRQKYIQLGLKRVKEFTWEKTAKLVLKEIEKNE